jgi:hypothetical protein
MTASLLDWLSSGFTAIQICRGVFVVAVYKADNMRKRINVNMENAQTDKNNCVGG